MNSIQSLYKKEGYFEKYGGSVFMTSTILVVASGLIGYFYVMSQLRELDAQWTTLRCSPQYIPFAGLIHPEDGKSVFDTTGDNFVQCSNQILSEISAYETMPLYYLTEASHSVFDSLTGVLNVARKDYAQIRNELGSVFGELYQKIEAFLVPLRFMFLKQQAALKKTQGVMVTMLYSVLSVYLALRAFIKTFLDIVILALVAFAVIIAILFAMIFSIPAAIASLVIFIAVVGAVTPVIIWAENLLAITSPKLPNKPSCFSPSTSINVYRPKSIFSKKRVRKSIPIRKVVPGDWIYTIDDADPIHADKVCAVMEMNGTRTNLVHIHGIVISENHPVVWRGSECSVLYGSMSSRSDNTHTSNRVIKVDTAQRSKHVYTNALIIGKTYPALEIARILDPDTYRVPNEPRLFCISTLRKSIHFMKKDPNNHTDHANSGTRVEALDWDELDNHDIQTLISYMNQVLAKQEQATSTLSNTETSSRYISRVVQPDTPPFTKHNLHWVHHYLQGGFHGNSLITIRDTGETKKLANLRIGDPIVVTLPQCIEVNNDVVWKTQVIHDQVLGIVRIDATDIDVFEYEWLNKSYLNPCKKYWVGGPNCMRFVKSTELTNSIPNYCSKFDTTLEWGNGKQLVPSKIKPKLLYHIVTASGLIDINGLVMYDYNGCIDNLLGVNTLYIPKGC